MSIGSFFLIMDPNLSAKGLGEPYAEVPTESFEVVAPFPKAKVVFLAGDPAALPTVRSGLD